jgi:RHS repeat-associated protein
MVARAYNSSNQYRFGYGGMEHDDAMGEDNYTTLERNYDARIARWTSNDPIFHEYQSSYAAFDNNPIYFNDPSGSKSKSGDDDKKKVINLVIIAKDRTTNVTKEGESTPTTVPDEAIVTMYDAAKSAEDPGKFEVVEVANAEEAFKKLQAYKDAGYTFGTITFMAHGGYEKASFRIGADVFNESNIATPDKTEKLKKIGGLIKGSTVVFASCHAGAKHNGGEKLMTKTAELLQSTVYANTSWSWASSPMFNTGSNFGFTYHQAGYADPKEKNCSYALREHAYKNAGIWNKFTPTLTNGKSNIIMESVNTLYFKSNGSIGISSENWADSHKEELEVIKTTPQVNPN